VAIHILGASFGDQCPVRRLRGVRG
jgi:hypothetical protein